jgi:hypothetical protein
MCATKYAKLRSTPKCQTALKVVHALQEAARSKTWVGSRHRCETHPTVEARGRQQTIVPQPSTALLATVQWCTLILTICILMQDQRPDRNLALLKIQV